MDDLLGFRLISLRHHGIKRVAEFRILRHERADFAVENLPAVKQLVGLRLLFILGQDGLGQHVTARSGLAGNGDKREAVADDVGIFFFPDVLFEQRQMVHAITSP